MLLRHGEEFAEAATELNRVLGIQRKTLTASHPELATTLELYASVLWGMAPPDEDRADEMEAQAKSIRGKHGAESRPE